MRSYAKGQLRSSEWSHSRAFTAGAAPRPLAQHVNRILEHRSHKAELADPQLPRAWYGYIHDHLTQ
jgi:hypothetical protein